MKKILCFIIAVVMIVTLVGCAKDTSKQTPVETEQGGESDTAKPAENNADGPEFKFVFATSATSDSIIGQTMQKAIDLINERSDGKIVVDSFPD